MSRCCEELATLLTGSRTLESWLHLFPVATLWKTGPVTIPGNNRGAGPGGGWVCKSVKGMRVGQLTLVVVKIAHRVVH